MPLEIVRNDITRMKVDAVVNAANCSLLGGGGVDGAIHMAAGPELLAECRTLGGCETGQAKITGGYRLPARYVIHTVGPVWHGGEHGERELLVSCYEKSLELAATYQCESVAFPMISAGAYGYPKDQAMMVAVETITRFLLRHEMTVFLVVFGHEEYITGTRLFRDVRAYIDDAYADGRLSVRRENQRRFLWHRSRREALELDAQIMEELAPKASARAGAKPEASPEKTKKRRKHSEGVPDQPTGSFEPIADLQEGAREPGKPSTGTPDQSTGPFRPVTGLPHHEAVWGEPQGDGVPAQSGSGVYTQDGAGEDDVFFSRRAENLTSFFETDWDEILKKKDEGFTEALLRMIDERNMTDAQCYRKANIDRKLFSKIHSNPAYKPSKPTALAFAVALELTLSETETFIRKAGYALTRSSKFDLVVEYCIRKRIYDVNRINMILFELDLPLLGSSVA